MEELVDIQDLVNKLVESALEATVLQPKIRELTVEFSLLFCLGMLCGGCSR